MLFSKYTGSVPIRARAPRPNLIHAPFSPVLHSRARVLEDEADLLIEETNRMANDQLLANTPIAQQPRFLREARTREERVARLLSTFEAEVPETTQADAGAKGGLDSEKPGVVEFAVVSALGHLSFKLNDGWRQQYEKLARFAVSLWAFPTHL